jgi:large subunit ribosomal protein L9
LINRIKGKEIKIKQKANEKNHLFASLTAQKLADILKKDIGVDIDSNMIGLKSPIKEIGTFEVPILVSSSAEAKFMLVVERA